EGFAHPGVGAGDKEAFVHRSPSPGFAAHSLKYGEGISPFSILPATEALAGPPGCSGGKGEGGRGMRVASAPSNLSISASVWSEVTENRIRHSPACTVGGRMAGA